MSKKEYQIGFLQEVEKPLVGQSLRIAKVIDREISSTQPLKKSTLLGIIRLSSDVVGIGDHLDIEKVWSDFTDSGFVTSIDTE